MGFAAPDRLPPFPGLRQHAPSARALFFPEIGTEEDKDGVELEPSGEHAEGEQPFSRGGQVAIVIDRPDQVQPGPDVAEGGGDAGEGGDNIDTKQGHADRCGDKDEHIDDEKGEDIGDHIGREHTPAHADRDVGVGMEQFFDLGEAV